MLSLQLKRGYIVLAQLNGIVAREGRVKISYIMGNHTALISATNCHDLKVVVVYKFSRFSQSCIECVDIELFAPLG